MHVLLLNDRRSAHSLRLDPGRTSDEIARADFQVVVQLWFQSLRLWQAQPSGRSALTCTAAADDLQGRLVGCARR
jgi:hypothetical protein